MVRRSSDLPQADPESGVLSRFFLQALNHRYYPTSMILTGETCEVSKTSQVFAGQTSHDHCGEVLRMAIPSSEKFGQTPQTAICGEWVPAFAKKTFPITRSMNNGNPNIFLRCFRSRSEDRLSHSYFFLLNFMGGSPAHVAVTVNFLYDRQLCRSLTFRSLNSVALIRAVSP